jgi:predicted SAM-dependent methyltransferase
MATIHKQHPLIGRLEVLDEQPPYERAMIERLGLRGIQFGCGPNLRRRWLNTDRRVYADPEGRVSPPERIVRATTHEGTRDRYFLHHDAFEPYPIEDESFEFAHSEHFIEHLPLDSAIAWLRETRRLVRSGGLVRLATPDLRKYVEGYLDPEGSFFAEHREALLEIPKFRESGVPDRRGFMVNQIFRYFNHQWIYDLEEVRAAAGEAGFDPDAVTECSFQEGRLPEVSKMDLASRSDESLYVEIART